MNVVCWRRIHCRVYRKFIYNKTLNRRIRKRELTLSKMEKLSKSLTTRLIRTNTNENLVYIIGDIKPKTINSMNRGKC